MPDFSTLQLHTARLQMRPLQPADATALFAIFSDPEVMRYWSSSAWTRMDQAETTIANDQRQLAEGQHLRLGLLRQEDGLLVGTCSLFNLSAQCRRAEVGYGLRRDAWGQGLVQEALGALMAHAFGPLGLNRLEADIDPRNTLSARSLERLGFQREGLLRERWIVGDEVSDSALYGLLRQDWLKRQPA